MRLGAEVSAVVGQSQRVERIILVLHVTHIQRTKYTEIRPLAGGLPLLPEDVRRGERGMAAQVHFDLRREPAQVEMVGLFHEEGRLGEIHLPGDCLKPAVLFPGR